jgi:hypothetical protein
LQLPVCEKSERAPSLSRLEGAGIEARQLWSALPWA